MRPTRVHTWVVNWSIACGSVAQMSIWVMRRHRNALQCACPRLGWPLDPTALCVGSVIRSSLPLGVDVSACSQAVHECVSCVARQKHVDCNCCKCSGCGQCAPTELTQSTRGPWFAFGYRVKCECQVRSCPGSNGAPGAHPRDQYRFPCAHIRV